MRRWSEAYKARASRRDNVDSVDNVPPPPAAVSHSVNIVNSVTVSPALNEAASDAAFEATERAALMVEGASQPILPHPARVKPQSKREGACHILPPAWGDAAVIPTPGARCYCCLGARWWCEVAEPSGWRCAVCHPPGHLGAGAVREVFSGDV